ncbi:hypothetical protein S83_055516, partial [Arachis hypogaea]
HAAEAFLHLLCSLREEIGGTDRMSMKDGTNSNLDLLMGFLEEKGSKISINLEQFDCLPLSPVLSGSTL